MQGAIKSYTINWSRYSFRHPTSWKTKLFAFRNSYMGRYENWTVYSCILYIHRYVKEHIYHRIYISQD
jgi:hypothetical protein